MDTLRPTHFCVTLVHMKREPQLTPPQRISASLLTDALRSASEDVREAEAHLASLRAVRDDLIRDALQVIPMMKLVRITHLSRERLYGIKMSPPTDQTTPEPSPSEDV